MTGAAMEESELGRSFEGFSSEQQQQICQTGEAIAEWRSSEQVENGSTSTSPPYWDSDEEDDGGPKPSDLYGKYTWKIDKFSQVNKRELRSNPFEVGGYSWYILIYPQGCDVCNHLSLFLCVANHDKLLPGWSHFAQFTIAVVNKDPKKSKYSDTLHRFWKKEHDWGWKKFMELSKVVDGFLDDDTLVIKAQVQVIREKSDRPFRCLDHQYRRELVRVYLSNVEQICRRFVEERKTKLAKLLEDKTRWQGFSTFWNDMDETTRTHMSQEKTELILKVIVKHFFIEKEVTSTLVMDAMYSGLKALESQNTGKDKGKVLEAEESLIPIICIKKDALVLLDDVLKLLQRAATEPLPPKEEKGPQNRTKDVTVGEDFTKDSFERDEKRLTELGRRTIEVFVLAHIFSKIEVAYQEAVALMKQEELIREEEASGLEQKARRGEANKGKKSKKKQKRNSRKVKGKAKDDKAQDNKAEQYDATAERKDAYIEPETTFEKSNAVEDASDASDSVECVAEVLPPKPEDTAASPASYTDSVSPPAVEELETSSSVQNGKEERGSPQADDSSSTCSSDSVLPAVRHNGNSRSHINENSPRRQNQQRRQTSDGVDWGTEEASVPSEYIVNTMHPNGISQSSSPGRSVSGTVRFSQASVANGTGWQVGKKAKEVEYFHQNSHPQDTVVLEPSADAAAARASPATSPTKNVSTPPPKSEASSDAAACRTSPARSPSKSIPPPKLGFEINIFKKQPLDNRKVSAAATNPSNSSRQTTKLKPDTPKPSTAPKPGGHPWKAGRDNKPQGSEVVAAVDKPSALSIPVVTRSLSAPLAPGSNPAVPLASRVQTPPPLLHAVSTAGRLGPDASTTSIPAFVPHSYRNAIVGGPSIGRGSSVHPQNHSVLLQEPVVFPSQHRSNSMDLSPLFVPTSRQNMLPNRSQWIEHPQTSHIADSQSFGAQDRMPDEFPHLDIINELLDDEHGIGFAARANSGHLDFGGGGGGGGLHLNRHYSFPGDPNFGAAQSSCRFDRTHSYHGDLLHHAYNTSGRGYEALPGSGPQIYANGRVDGYLPAQFPVRNSDVPFFGVARVDESGYPYRFPAEYQIRNRYGGGVYRQSSSNGH
ncbi:TNF receptor-associated factor homolog 1a-like isoform X2 [Andrographis paniculata]|uniref:TNF receptor-associated factor homolog 1a-like isoform X2 n=1 Tax=Andrographis paniculata TaxID=175694 RepID=UPI0021E7C114|nr:TNF receptor-associated factor homolog 1a-like isoform X2 [Andrographis paniculata]